eukprot:scaffold66723_cov40-Tisochrysis_lutea.AAC.1
MGGENHPSPCAASWHAGGLTQTAHGRCVHWAEDKYRVEGAWLVRHGCIPGRKSCVQLTSGVG